VATPGKRNAIGQLRSNTFTTFAGCYAQMWGESISHQHFAGRDLCFGIPTGEQSSARVSPDICPLQPWHSLVQTYKTSYNDWVTYLYVALFMCFGNRHTPYKGGKGGQAQEA